MASTYQICTNCIMDTSDPDIVFDQHGVCSHCLAYKTNAKRFVDAANTGAADEALAKLVSKISNAGKGKDYDCVIGLSGGVDSTYVALKVRELGLRPLAVHFDSGWNSELAVNNIENIVKRLDIDLVTYVCDWDEMRDLQLAFFKAGVANCDTPTDHAFLAILYSTAAVQNIKHIVTGTNLATEYILPKAWGYSPADVTHLRAIHKKFGRHPLISYPTLGFFARFFYYPVFKGIRIVRILNFMPYDKQRVKTVIQEKLGWRDYGGKHYESIFTRFFQAYYLPRKFGYDKRRAHLSSLIVSGQLARQDALEELKLPADAPERLVEDKEFVAKKLGITLDEFDAIVAEAPHHYTEYPNEEWLHCSKDRIWATVKRIRGL